MNDVKAGIEESDVRLNEVAREEMELKRDIEAAPVHPRTGKLSFEKLEAYLDHQVTASSSSCSPSLLPPPLGPL